MAFSPDGSLIVTGHDSGDVLVWEVATGKIRSRFPSPLKAISFVGFYPDARTIAIVAQEDTIRFWKHDPAPELPPMRHEQKAEIWDLTFANNGRELISADDRHRIRITDTATQTEVRTLVDHGTQVSALAISPDQRTLVSGDYDGGLMLRDLDLPGAPGGIGRLPGMVRSMAWSPDGRYLAVCGRAPEIFLWDRKTGESRHVPTPHTNAHSLAWSPDGRTLAVGSHMKQITFWRMPEVALIKTIETLTITGLAWSQDGRMLAAGSGEGILLLFDAASGALRREVRGASDQGAVWDLAFSPDGKTLATGGDDKLVRLWDPNTGRELLRLEGHESKVHAVAFSPDGNTLASGDFAGNLRLWRAAVDQ
jgi:WD40 repeat protein